MSFSKIRQDSVQHPEVVEVVIETQDDRLVKEYAQLLQRVGEKNGESKYTIYFVLGPCRGIASATESFK